MIATEFAQIFARLGTKVTLVARGVHILSDVDHDAVAVIERSLRRDGVRIMHGTKAREARRSHEGWVELDLERFDGEVETLHADVMLVATGRTPKIDGLDLAAAGIDLDPTTAGPLVDRELRTTNPHVWAIGDALGRQLYTHVANHEGPYAAKNALSDMHLVPDFYDEVPGAVFCDPELATVGLRSDEAAERGYDAITGTYPMTRNGKARAMSKEDGFIRMVVERKHAQDPRRHARLPRRGQRAAGDPRRDGRRRHDRRRSASRSTRTRRSSRPSTRVRARSSRTCRLALVAGSGARVAKPGRPGAAYRLSRTFEG